MGEKIQDSGSCPDGWCAGPTEKEHEGIFWSDGYALYTATGLGYKGKSQNSNLRFVHSTVYKFCLQNK